MIILQFFVNNGILEPEIYTVERMNNFYEYISSEFNINPSKSTQELIVNGTLFNAPKSLNAFLKITDDNKNMSVINDNYSQVIKNEGFVEKKRLTNSLPKNNENSAIRITMKEWNSKKTEINKKESIIDFVNPNHIINVVENEFKKAKIIPKTESFFSQLGEFKEIKRGKKKSYEETTLKNVNLRNNEEQKESIKKKKLLEYIMV